MLPSPDDIASYYSYEGQLKADVSGNVATVTVSQPASQLRRGGSLWALALYFARSGQREKSRRAAGKWRELAGQAWSERDQERFDALLDGSP